jgi:hypothetical protein
MNGDPLAGTGGSNPTPSTRSIRAPKVLPVLIDMEDEPTWSINNLVVRVDLEGVLRQPNPSSMFRRKLPLIIAR